MWIVGDARRFNAEGSVPTNTTRSDILRDHDENDWLTGEDIRLVATLAALFHDLGKACQAFQTRLRGEGPHPANVYRHEWVSLRLIQAFVGQDDDASWLARLQDPAQMTTTHWEKCLKQAGLRDGEAEQGVLHLRGHQLAIHGRELGRGDEVAALLGHHTEFTARIGVVAQARLV